MSTCPNNTELCMYSGDDQRVIVEVFDQDGQLVDISDATDITWSVSNNPGSSALITKSLGSGISIANPTTFVFDLVPADTASLNGSYYHEAEIVTSGAFTYTVMSGRIRIKPTLI